MRRAIGYPLAVLSAWMVADWVSHVDQRWSWYGPSHGDDALAAAVWVVLSIVLARVVRKVTR